ncbi:MAG: CDP-diacylglycerol--glycerol-3-phosphate 3-phosphatidyltransferase [Candidatus Nanopelagicales bacterium]
MRPAPADPAGLPATGGPVLNLPNALTGLRILAVPVLIWLLASDDPQARTWATVVFLVAAVTDLVDGAIARRKGQITSFGKLADPIADKALIGTALIGLSLLGDLAWWVTVVILARELGVTALRMWVIQHGVIPASRGGKAKTVSQVIAIGMYLYAPTSLDWWSTAAQAAMAVAIALTLITGVDYILRAVRLRRPAVSNA